MFLHHYLKSCTSVVAIAASALFLGGCAIFSGGSGCESRGVPTLNENQCLLPNWVNFARQSQQADDHWRSIVLSNMSDNSVRAQLVRAVALSWAPQHRQLVDADKLYRHVEDDVPDALVPLVKLLHHDVNARADINTQLNNARYSLSSSHQSQAAKISALQQSNDELRHKLSELANIEASMDRHRTQ